MRALVSTRLLRFLGMAVLAGILAGCASAPPPAPVPEPRRQAFYAASVAAKLSQAENWKAAAKQWQKTAESFALIHDRTNQAIAWHNLAQAERELGQYKSATNWLQIAAELNQTLNQTNEWWRNQIVLLQIEAQLDLTNSVELRFEDLNRRLPRLAATDIRGLFFLELCRWQLQKSEFIPASLALQQAATNFTQAGMANGLAAASLASARLHQAQGRTAQAITEWRRALAQYEDLADPAGVAASLEGLGKSLMENRELQAAEEALFMAVGNNRTLRKSKALASSLRALIECRRRQNKSADALITELDGIGRNIQ